MKKELLQQLIKECTTEKVFYDHLSTEYTSYFDKNKFADMVVNLCLTELKEFPPGYKDYRSQIEDHFRHDIIAEIKYKFGVNQ